MHRGGKEIGEISASLEESSYTETYTILSDVSFRILWKQYRRKTSNLVVYQGESMKTSYCGVYMNNDLQDSTAMHKEQNSYRVFKYPDGRYQLDNTELNFSTAKLYFQEPVGVQNVYSERFLQQCRLEAQGNHRYKLHLPDNKKNYYTYKDRQLVAVSIERTWFNLEFRKK
ncbi:MAG: hypothetical protein DHS20C17_17610 [Cyclobacteriaceae bacterium]|nr:MAG: hypothetical protein DHS20C17_17610 [Cyclobacteriaceae bacterium]